jgi:hypothetical protein
VEEIGFLIVKGPILHNNGEKMGVYKVFLAEIDGFWRKKKLVG